MQLAGQVIEGLLWFFIAFMWVRFVTEWVQVFARSWSPRGVLLVALELVYSVTDPPKVVDLLSAHRHHCDGSQVVNLLDDRCLAA